MPEVDEPLAGAAARLDGSALYAAFARHRSILLNEAAALLGVPTVLLEAAIATGRLERAYRGELTRFTRAGIERALAGAVRATATRQV